MYMKMPTLKVGLELTSTNSTEQIWNCRIG